MVKLETNFGDITIKLDTEKAPITVENFLQYVDDGFYENTIFHRVIEGFMIQGGGFNQDMTQKDTKAEIKNEANNGLSNDHYTIAMARTAIPHSASSQFFINGNNNDFLNHTSETPNGWGYCVFGIVVEGMEVVDSIIQTKTGNSHGHQDVPTEPVVISKASRCA